MQNLFNELKSNKVVSLATVTSDNKPNSRFVDIMDFDVDNKSLFILLGNHKEVYKEITNNPAIALNGFNDMVTYRLTGECNLETDRDLAPILAEHPQVAKMYEGRENLLALVEVKLTSAIRYDLSLGMNGLTKYEI